MILKMSWRNVWRNKMRSIVIMISIAIGILAGICVLGLYKGMMKSRIRNVIESEVGHLQIHHPLFKKDYNPIYVIDNPENTFKEISTIPKVKIAGKRTIIQGMLVSSTGSAGVQINGVIPEVEYKLSLLKQKIIIGNGFNKNKNNEVLIGKKLSDKLKIKNGKKIVLTFTDTANNIVSAAFKVCGIYQSDNMQMDETNLYVDINTINELLLINNSYNEIAVILNNDDDLEKIKKKITTEFPSLQIETWKEISPETDLLVKTVDEYSYIIIIIILIALSFGIINTMLMSVLERTKEIGMMLALGTSKIKVFFLVLIETLLLTIVGAPLGLIASFLIIKYYQKVGLDLSGMGKEMMASFGFNTMIYPDFPWEKISTILIMVIGIAILSCILPAIKVMKLKPVEALRQ